MYENGLNILFTCLIVIKGAHFYFVLSIQNVNDIVTCVNSISIVIKCYLTRKSFYIPCFEIMEYTLPFIILFNVNRERGKKELLFKFLLYFFISGTKNFTFFLIIHFRFSLNFILFFFFLCIKRKFYLFPISFQNHHNLLVLL